jgi:glycosyltransferase involved in cell wall biosynthesis
MYSKLTNLPKPLKIAIVHPNMFTVGGAEKLITWFSEELVSQGHQVAIITKYPPKHIHPNVQVIKFDIDLNALNWYFTVKKLAKELNEYDIINTHNFPSSLFGYWIKKKNRSSKLIWYCHEPFDVFYGKTLIEANDLLKNKWKKSKIKYIQENISIKLDKNAVKNHDFILCNSKRTNIFTKQLFNVNNCDTLYPGLPEKYFSKDETNKKNYEKEIKLIVISRLFKVKNIITIIKVFQELIKKNEHFTLKIVGEGDQKKSLLQYIKKNRLENKINMLGNVSEEELLKLYSESFLTINIPNNEPFGLITLESLAHGVPIILSKDSGSAEILSHRKSGILITPNNESEIFNEILSLTKNKHDYIRISESGKKLIKENYTIKKFTKEFFSFVSRETLNND